MSDKKYIPAQLPSSVDEALEWATEREEWAKMARERDQPGSAREWELTALLLRQHNAAMSLLDSAGIHRDDYIGDTPLTLCDRIHILIERREGSDG